MPGKAVAEGIDPRARRPAVIAASVGSIGRGVPVATVVERSFVARFRPLEAQPTLCPPTERTMPLPALPKTFLALALGGLVAATPALAHHPMGGTTPATLSQGLLSGLGHPVIGLDHLAALVAVGLLASRFARGAWLPLAWLAAMALGVTVHLGRIDLPFGEVMVALSL